jgi:aspartyl-tRNA(Asn)/glutamyl-tRNA(Gln) amidotransferase subunit B
MPLSDFEVVMGLEVHAQLLTRSKIFCGCSTEFGGEPNTHTCPVCLAMPGVLPSLNRRVVELALRAGLALGCEVKRKSVWARKNYFYPDLPKGYQISQYELPICEGGGVPITYQGKERTVALVRIHMEEDAGKNLHDVAADGSSGVDLNRAGVPLVEIVSAPDLYGADEAIEYLKSLRAILMYLGVNDGNLEEGSFRCDANVSVRPRGSPELGQRCEIKNMNSFRFLKQAVEYEARRQVEVIESGGKVAQETRLFDPVRGETRPMRSKEDAPDYRYFPEPDLPPLLVDDALVEEVRRAIPELPHARAARYQRELGLSAYDAQLLTAERATAEFFDAALRLYGPGAAGKGQGADAAKDAAKKVANWVTGEAARLSNERGVAPAAWGLRPQHLATVLRKLDAGELNQPGAKQLFEAFFRSGAAAGETAAESEAFAAEVIRARGLGQVSDEGAIEGVVERIVAASPAEVERYRGGNKKLLGFFVGQVMKELKGKGNPALVNALVKKKLGD